MFFRRSTSIWGIAPLCSALCFALACSSEEGGEPKPYTEEPVTGDSAGGSNGAGANNTNGASNGDSNGNGARDDDAGDVPNPPGPRDAGSMGGFDAMVSLDSGITPDSGTSLDSGAAADAGNSLDSGSADSGPADSGSSDSGPGDSGPGLDAGPGLDSGPGIDSGTGADAGPAADSGTKPDAGPADAGPACGTTGVVAGNDCPGVVTCQDEGFSGDPVLECALTGPAASRCCTTPFGANDSCRTTSCGANDDEARCDGPEDCAGNAAGAVCCFDAGAAACATTCSNPNRMCHRDADCPTGATCEVGSNSQGSRYSWWGFCRGT